VPCRRDHRHQFTGNWNVTKVENNKDTDIVSALLYSREARSHAEKERELAAEGTRRQAIVGCIDHGNRYSYFQLTTLARIPPSPSPLSLSLSLTLSRRCVSSRGKIARRSISKTTKWIKETRDSLYENASLQKSRSCLSSRFARRGGMKILMTR